MQRDLTWNEKQYAMNSDLEHESAPNVFSTSLPAQTSETFDSETSAVVDSAFDESCRPKSASVASGSWSTHLLQPWRAAYVAFFAIVLACLAAAAAVVSTDMPLSLGGF